MRLAWVWIVPGSLVLPMTHSVVAALRFGTAWLFRLSEQPHVGLPIGDKNMLVESLIFLPASAIAAMAFIFWLGRARSRQAKIGTSLGYVLGLPVACFGSLMLPLMFDPWIGATLGGAVPWLLLTWFGYLAARGSATPV